MLKKILVGIFCFIILAVTGAGIYIYTLDWNKHKAVVAQRLSQITGLRAVIDGNLNVKLFPSPKFTAGKVKFLKSNGGRDPLIEIDTVEANVDLMPLLNDSFIIRSMNLRNAKAHIIVDEKGVLNWKGVGNNSSSKSGNMEVSFNDVNLSGAVISYDNMVTKDKFEIPNITARVNASSLKGPYKTSGKFIYNNSEVQFKGDIINDKSPVLKVSLSNASSGATLTIDGTTGNDAKGNVTFDTQTLSGISNLIFGEASLPERYNRPLYVSFQYGYGDGMVKFDNFSAKYDKNTAGSGTVIAKKHEGRIAVNADFDMTKFDLNLLTGLGEDIVTYFKNGKKITDSPFSQYDMNISIKSGTALYNNIEAQNLNLGITLLNNVIDITRFGLSMPGDTSIKTVGRINLLAGGEYIFNQIIDTKDLRTFASVFNIDLAKLASDENKKSIFKKAAAEIKINGNLDSLKISVPLATVDATTFKGNLGFVKKDKATYVIADFDASQINLDKYIKPMPTEIKKGSLQDKFVYQMNLIPWNRDLDVESSINVASVVYHNVPMKDVSLQFTTNQDNLTVQKLSFGSIAGAALNLNLAANHIFSSPFFDELSYDISTANFPMFTSTLGIDTGDKPLFKRKIFAAQGALSGTLSEFSLSSVQKFGDTEFSYTGTVSDNPKSGMTVNGDLELKSNNVSSFIKALDFDYTPDIPVTTFTLAAKVKGAANLFSLDNISAYLGANGISGNLQYDHTTQKPKLAATLDFDKFEADRWLNLSDKSAKPAAEQASSATFIQQPAWDEKIDYSLLGKIDTDFAITAKQLNLYNKLFTSAKTKLQLKNGVLNVSSFEATEEKSLINLHFILDSNNIPKIDGYFNVSDYKTPKLGGSLYALESGWISAEGNFNSLAGSPKDFFNNLNSKGKFSLNNTAMSGWDLDIIKFEFEQRQKVAGFENSVLNSLKSGKSSFNKIRGNYSINKGLVVADSVIWESPVVNMQMKFDFNFSDWLFTAVFDAVYHNASFSDVLKFTFSGNLANPEVTTDLSESIKRISKIEDQVKNARYYKEQEKMERIGGKIKELKEQVDKTLQDIGRITPDVVRFKPQTKNQNVTDVYEENVQLINNVELAVKKMKEALNGYPEEETLMNIEADLGAERAKLKYIPKVLEENFLVDSKYIFDDTFNKIAWIYNVAQNNSAYYSGLTDVYMAQIEFMDASDTPVDPDKAESLQNQINKIDEIMDNLSSLHAKIRDNYLNIIDTAKTSEMKKNNELATQALKTMLAYTKQLNNDILASLDDFSTTLNITSRDYDQYLVYPPESIDDIDVKQPTVKIAPSAAVPTTNQNKTAEKNSSDGKAPLSDSTNAAEKNISVPQGSNPADTDANQPASQSEGNKTKDIVSSAEEITSPISKKKESLSLTLAPSANGLSGLFDKLKTEKEESERANIMQAGISGGLQQVIKSNIETASGVSSSQKSPVLAVSDMTPAGNTTTIQTAAAAQAETTAALIPQTDIQAEQTPVPEQISTPLNTEAAYSGKIAMSKSALPENKTSPAMQTVKTESILSNTAEKKEEKPAQPGIAAKKASPLQTLPGKNMAITQNDEDNILEQTKSALNKIMGKLKAAKEKAAALTTAKKTTTDKNDRVAAVESPAPDAKKNETQKNGQPLDTLPGASMKVNPVVALNIGKKPSESDIDAEPRKYASRRKKFSSPAVATNASKPLPSAVADISRPAKHDVFNSGLAATAHPIPTPSATQAIVQAASQASAPVEGKKNVLVEMISLADVFSGANSSFLTQEALTSVESFQKPQTSKTRYVFQKGQLPAEKSGIVGKSMLYGRKAATKPDKPANRYVFAAAPYRSPLSGETRKRNSLSEI